MAALLLFTRYEPAEFTRLSKKNNAGGDGLPADWLRLRRVGGHGAAVLARLV